MQLGAFLERQAQDAPKHRLPLGLEEVPTEPEGPSSASIEGGPGALLDRVTAFLAAERAELRRSRAAALAGPATGVTLTPTHMSFADVQLDVEVKGSPGALLDRVTAFLAAERAELRRLRAAALAGPAAGAAPPVAHQTSLADASGKLCWTT